MASAHFQGPAPPVSTNCWKTQQSPGPQHPAVHPGPASCLFHELSTWTRRASLLTSTQTTHSTRSTDLKSPQTLEEQQLWERFREEFCETVCNTTDFNTTVRNTICKPRHIGDLGSPRSTRKNLAGIQVGLETVVARGQARPARGACENAPCSPLPLPLWPNASITASATGQHQKMPFRQLPVRVLQALSHVHQQTKLQPRREPASQCQAGTPGRRVCTAAVDAHPPEGE